MADIDYGEVFGLDTVTETADANDTPDTSVFCVVKSLS